MTWSPEEPARQFIGFQGWGMSLVVGDGGEGLEAGELLAFQFGWCSTNMLRR